MLRGLDCPIPSPTSISNTPVIRETSSRGVYLVKIFSTTPPRTYEKGRTMQMCYALRNPSNGLPYFASDSRVTVSKVCEVCLALICAWAASVGYNALVVAYRKTEAPLSVQVFSIFWRISGRWGRASRVRILSCE
jgi:hypothetical protein